MQEYHVALSFAGEERKYVEEVATDLLNSGVKVFYDAFEEINMWGKNLYTHLSDVYQNQALYTVIFVSKSYKEKVWTNHERESAQARALSESREYILPAKFDTEIEIPGLSKTTAYINLNHHNPNQFAKIIIQKLQNGGIDLPIQGGNDGFMTRPSTTFRSKIEEYQTYMAEYPVVAIWKGMENIKVVDPGDLRDVFLFERDSTGKSINNRRDFYELKEELISQDTLLLIVGRAGIGKTTLCHILCKSLLGGIASDKIIPIVISLPHLDEVTLNDPLSYEIPCLDISIGELVGKHRNELDKILIFLDGLNEIADEPRLKLVSIFSNRVAAVENISMVATSRVIGISPSLCHRFGNKLRIYEMELWDLSKVRTYLEKNSRHSATRLTKKELELLRLPLMASLYVQTETICSESLFSEASLIHNFLRPATNDPQSSKFLKQIAFNMTVGTRTTVKGSEIESIINDKEVFSRFCRIMIYEGVLRVIGVRTFDREIEFRDLIRYTFMFSHQSLQEHLTAHYILDEEPWSRIPSELSNSAFWQQVPLHAMEIIQMRDSTDAIDFIDKFLHREDYLTAARLSNKLRENSAQIKMQKSIHFKLLEHLCLAHSYAAATKAFQEIGDYSSENLIQMLQNSLSLEKIIAVPEFHMFPKKTERQVRAKFGPNDEQIEKEWRKIGRVISILGELGNEKLVILLLSKINLINSRHLIYHALESILLVLQSNPSADLINEVSNKIQNAGWLIEKDAIIEAYEILLIHWSTREDMSKKKVADQLVFFLQNQLENRNQLNFNDKFWQRAHGFLVLAEIAATEDVLLLYQAGFNIESNPELTPYSSLGFKGYHAVLPAIVTGLLRLQQSGKLEFGQFKDIAEDMIKSERFSESSWACLKLEDLLLRACGNEDIDWIDHIVQSSLPERTKRMMDNLRYMLIG